jgi:ribosomal protein S18 acetylase RimI-like enzyme
MRLDILEGPVANLDVYASIPISFVVKSRLDVSQLWLGEIAEELIDTRTKDYDALESVVSLPERFDVANWGCLRAQIPTDSHAVGGAIVAWNSPDVDMLQGRKDLAVLWDIRVHPIFRGKGVGRALFEHAAMWAKDRGCTEMRVETQDTNVAACKFYRQMGCRILTIEENAYAFLDEAKIVWTTRV